MSGHSAEDEEPRCHGRAHTIPPPVVPGATCVCGAVVMQADPGVRVLPPGSGDSRE